MRRPTPKDARRNYWREALAAKAEKARTPAIYEDEPQPGFYEFRARNKPSRGVHFLLVTECDQQGELVADERVVAMMADGAVIIEDFDAVCDLWVSVARHPLTPDEFAALKERERTSIAAQVNLRG